MSLTFFGRPVGGLRQGPGEQAGSRQSLAGLCAGAAWAPRPALPLARQAEADYAAEEGPVQAPQPLLKTAC